MARNNNIITAIDIGSYSIKGIVARTSGDNKEIAVLSYVNVPSVGLRRGVITDTEIVSEKINQVLDRMKNEIKPQKIKEVFINIGGPRVTSQMSHGAVAISRADQKVSHDDKMRVVEEARSISLNYNREVLDIFPKEFVVDSETGLKDVVGMKGIKLEVQALVVSVFSLYLQKLVDTVLSADVEVAGVIPSALAASEALLTDQQKELGSTVVDIGAETTSIVVFEDKSLIHLAILPIGSAHITRDIAIALQADIDVAEAIKKKFGFYIFQNRNRKEKIIIDKQEPFIFDTKKMIKAGRARVVEIFDLVNKELKKIDKQESLPAGVIITGGGSKIPGLISFVKKELKLPIKRGIVKKFIGIEEDASNSVVCGLIMTGIGREEKEQSAKSGKLISKFKRVIKALKIFVP
jgi:cell division protein FtsA